MKTVRSALIVDDNEPDVFLAKHFLDKSGRYHTTCSAQDPAEALRLFEHPESAQQTHPDCFPPRLMLLDINMPGMTGFDLLDALRALNATDVPPVVMLTSSSSHEDEKRAREHPLVHGYLVKPFSAEEAAHLADQFGE